MVFKEVELYENQKKFILVPVEDEKIATEDGEICQRKSDYTNVLIIDRISRKMQKIAIHDQKARIGLFQSMKTMSKIQGVVGIIQLITGSFLIVITERELVGMINQHQIYCLRKIQFVPYLPIQYHNADAKQKERDLTYLDMLNRILVNENAFFFSYTMDLTQNLQMQQKMRGMFDHKNYWKGSSDHFFWNRALASPLIENNANGYVLPMIRGMAEIHRCKIKSKTFYLGLVSRQSCFRAGTRYNMRGSDFAGNVANFVETEQIIIYDENVSSYTLIRGSIPLIWTQYANLKYTPEIKFLTDKQKQQAAFETHFKYLFSRFGEVGCVNLCRKHGQEKKLSDVFEAFWKNTKFEKAVRYVTFDFHNECKNMNFDKVVVLLNDISSDIKKFGFFLELKKESQHKMVTMKSEFDMLDKTEIKDISHSVEKQTQNNLLSFDDSLEDTSTSQSTSSSKTFSNPQPQIDSSIDSNHQQLTSSASNVLLSLVDGNESTDAQKSTKITKDIAKDFELMDITPKSTKIAPPSPKVERDDTKSSSIIKTQQGVFRVNCIDCCDRTNVVQTYISKTILKHQMLRVGILENSKELLSQFPEFESIFNNLWANNGDRISLLYSGTEALMRDYTRTGQRSVGGLIADGFNSAVRYVKNNFQDSERQRSINLVLGLLDIKSQEEIQEFQSSDIVSDLLLF